MVDHFTHMYETQLELQRDSFGVDIPKLSPEKRVEFIKDMTLALTDELHEALAEVGWKPWATSRHINEDAYKGELVDAFHFFLNLMMAVDMEPSELHRLYRIKRRKNAQRQADGYDGVTGKCSICKRALDDSAVKCEEPKGVLMGFCEVYGRTWN